MKPAPRVLASRPPIMPGARPGRSAMDQAIYPASNGTISLNAASPPICINAAGRVPGSL
ncbi:hypothetical protein D3C73_1309090 [compost metagenome]